MVGVGIQRIALFFVKDQVHIMARTAQISKEIITLRHEGQSIRKISITFKVSSSAVAKTIKHYYETGSHKDRHRKGRSRVTSAAGDKFIRVTCTSDRSPNKCFRVQVTDRHLNINCG
jgi:transposase